MHNEQQPDGYVPEQPWPENDDGPLYFLRTYARGLWDRAQLVRTPACFPGHFTLVDGPSVTIVPEMLAMEPPWKQSDIQLHYDSSHDMAISYRRTRRSVMRHDEQLLVREIDTYPLVSNALIKRTVQRRSLDTFGSDGFRNLNQYNLGTLTCEDIVALTAALSLIEGKEYRHPPGYMERMARLLSALLRRKPHKNGAVD